MTVSTSGKVIKVLIGQVSLTRAPNLLQAVLGSCIGLAIYDPQVGIAGMAHILLPNSEGREPGNLPGKYADRAVPCLYEALLSYGALPNNLKAKLAGGARMFEASMSYTRQDVGGANIDAVRKALRDMRIPIIAADTGGPAGRKVEFDVDSYRLTVEDFAQRKQII